MLKKGAIVKELPVALILALVTSSGLRADLRPIGPPSVAVDALPLRGAVAQTCSDLRTVGVSPRYHIRRVRTDLEGGVRLSTRGSVKSE